jgi:hypothetical protein
LLRREKVRECLESGIRAVTKIAAQLGVNKSTISRDITAIEEQFLADSKETVGKIKGRQFAQYRTLFAKWFPLAIADSHEAMSKDGPVTMQGPSVNAARIILKTMQQEADAAGIGNILDKEKDPNAFKDLAAKAAEAKKTEPPAPEARQPEVTPEIVAEAAEARHKGILS